MGYGGLTAVVIVRMDNSSCSFFGSIPFLLGSLKKFNVEQINPVGAPFDPQHHEAMSMVPAPDAEPNSVVAVVQKGYLLNGRVVRPAMVVVAKAEDAPKIDEQA